MPISSDQIVMGTFGAFTLNATLFYTWVVMAILSVGAWCITRRLSAARDLSPWQHLLEVFVTGLGDEIRGVSQQEPGPYLPFIATLFLFVAMSNLIGLVPGVAAPTGSLSTTAALAACVFAAVLYFGISARGLGGYLRQYLEPSIFMLPLNVIGEASRLIALAVRLYGNIMSGSLIAAILLLVVPFVVPVPIQLLGVLTGVIQAFIFAILAMVYIASATGPGNANDDRSGDNFVGARSNI